MTTPEDNLTFQPRATSSQSELSVDVTCWSSNKKIKMAGVYDAVSGVRGMVRLNGGDLIDPQEMERLADRASSNNWKVGMSGMGMGKGCDNHVTMPSP